MNNGMSDNRLHSRPFVSGDGFRGLAEIVVEGLAWGEGTDFLPQVFFAKPDYVGSSIFVRRAERAIRARRWQFPTLIIHNGDFLPELKVFNRLASLFSKVYAVNVVNPSWPATPVPIGLENAWHQVKANGQLMTELLLTAPQVLEHRKDIGVSFSESTNVVLRSAVRKIFQEAGYAFQQPRLSRIEYINWLRTHKFIISPPGNGNDCHRTWEAIYAGAVPVVLNSHLSKDFVEHLPIWGVDSYSDVVELSSEELSEKYITYSAKDSSMAFMQFWDREIGSSPGP